MKMIFNIEMPTLSPMSTSNKHIWSLQDFGNQYFNTIFSQKPEDVESCGSRVR